MTNTLPVVVEALTVAIRALDSAASEADIERVLVQMHQLALRSALDRHCQDLLSQTAEEARVALGSGDSAGARDSLTAALPCLRLSGTAPSE